MADFLAGHQEEALFLSALEIAKRLETSDATVIRAVQALARCGGVDSVPVVAITRNVRLPRVDVVVNDDLLGATLAVDHLVSLGHRRIAHVDGGGGSGAKRRARGFLDAMARHGLTGDARRIAGEYTEEAGAEGVAQLLAHRVRPTAIFCANDYQAVGAVDALRQAGLAVLEDVSVVGYDNVHLAALVKSIKAAASCSNCKGSTLCR